ncbi:MAG TPA: hypothetical protein VF625_19150, partial [Longimicrobium sp.]
MIRLPSGDSVEMVAVGPAVVPDQAPGLLVSYHPFHSLDDTTRIKTIAGELWRTRVKPGLRANGPSFVVLQATSRRAGPING